MRVGPGFGVVVIRSPFQTKFQFCRVPRMGGIKLQLLCGVRIELAIGSLPYPGNYLDIQFVQFSGLFLNGNESVSHFRFLFSNFNSTYTVLEFSLILISMKLEKCLLN